MSAKPTAATVKVLVGRGIVKEPNAGWCSVPLFVTEYIQKSTKNVATRDFLVWNPRQSQGGGRWWSAKSLAGVGCPHGAMCGNSLPVLAVVGWPDAIHLRGLHLTRRRGVLSLYQQLRCETGVGCCHARVIRIRLQRPPGPVFWNASVSFAPTATDFSCA